MCVLIRYSVVVIARIAHSEPGGTRWRTGGEVKGKLANGLGSQYSHATSERGISSITQADAHTSVASSRLNWRPHRFKLTRPFRGKTKSVFCACVITFRTSYTYMFRIEEFCFLTTVCLCVFYGSQDKQRLFPCTTLAEYFQNRDGKCLPRGRDWIFKCNSDSVLKI